MREIRKVDKVAVVELSGDLTFSPPSLGRALDLDGRRVVDHSRQLRRLLEQGNKNIVLDLRELTFLDSSGIGELIALKRDAVAAGGDVRLVRPRPRLQELFEAVRLDSIFDFFDDTEQAVQSFR